MNTVTITSQGQITIPAKIRKHCGITGSQELHLSFDARSRRIIIEKPLSVRGFLAIADNAAKHIPKDIKPLKSEDIHEFYERERTKEIVARMKESL